MGLQSETRNMEDIVEMVMGGGNEMSIKEMETLISRLISGEDRKDAEFRFTLLTTEIGDVGRYLTHDPVLNPAARPHGSKEDEKMAYGQAIVQLMGLAYIRGIDFMDAFRLGAGNWIDADWRRREANGAQKIMGQVGCPGFMRAQAYVVNSSKDFETILRSKTPQILVMEQAKSDFVSAIPYVAGLVTDNGGRLCHAAINCVDKGIPCIVGTGNATSLIKHGDLLEICAEPSGENYVKIITSHVI